MPTKQFLIEDEWCKSTRFG